MARHLDLTSADICAARDNDLAAITKVTDQTLPLIESIARRMAEQTGHTYGYLAEELAAEGRLILWTVVKSFEPMDDRHVEGWLVRTLDREMRASRRDITEPGADEAAIKVFRRCLRAAGGDPYLAEALAKRLPDTKARLGADRAAAARMAVSKTAYLDAPVARHNGSGPDKDYTLADLLADKKAATCDTDPTDTQRARAALVRATLDTLSEGQRKVLRAVYFDEMDFDTAAEVLDMDRTSVRKTKTKGRKSFYERFPFETAFGAPKPPMASE